MAATPRMHFERHGRTHQLRIRTADDLRRVPGLDDSFWMATSAPVSCLNSNAEFLDFVDLDSNQRIRADELRAAIAWTFERLADPTHLAEGTDEVALTWIGEATEKTRRLAAVARYIIETLGAESRETISVAQVEAFTQGLDKRPVNGDGVITPDAAEDAQTAAFIEDATRCTGGTQDLTGRTGITEQQLDAFLAAARAHLDWASKGDIPEGRGATEVMPLGRETPAAYEAFSAVELKVEGFFARCRVVRFNPGAAERIGIGANEVAPADLADPAAIDAALGRAPLAEPNPDGALPLDDSVNPVYLRAVEAFRKRVVAPLLGEGVRTLNEPQWHELRAALAPYAAWRAGKQGGTVEGLGRGKLANYVAGPHEGRVRAMLKADVAVADRLAEARRLKRLLLCHRHLVQLANNFVSFPDLYDPARRAAFEMGSLVMDGRWFNFAVKVEDVKEHARIARTSGMYVLYAEVTCVDAEDRMVVAVPVTSGTAGSLCLGKRGIFYDTHGRHYDARIVHIIENPVSFREALLSPFVRLGRFISGKIEAVSGTAEKALESKVGKATAKLQSGVQQAVTQAPAAPQQRSGAQQAASAAASRRDLLLGASVSVAALSSAFAYVTSKVMLMAQHPLGALLGIAAVVLVVFVPTAVVAAIKLRRRDLSALLEGCGWAVNARMRLDRRQRNQFTHRVEFPSGASGVPRAGLRLCFLLAVLAVLLAILAARALRPGAPRIRRGPAPTRPVPAAQR